MVLFFNNQKIFTVLLSKLSWSAFGGGGGQDLRISYLKQRGFREVVSVMERVRSKNLYKKSFNRNEL